MENSFMGVNVRGRTRYGVYHHLLERAHLCSTYMMYSALDRGNSGFLYAPLVQLRYPQHDPQTRMHVVRRSGANQRLTYPDQCRVTHVWLHVTHVLEFCEGDRQLMIMAEPCFARHLELHPHDTWDEIMRRSQEVGANAG
jgi:hypothetical protein